MNSIKKLLYKCIWQSRLPSLSIKGISARGVNNSRTRYLDYQTLLSKHFEEIANLDHPCRLTLGEALKKLNKKPAVIVETGSSAWGTNSSVLFDSYVNSFGGSFETVDLRIQPLVNLKTKCSPHTLLYCDDSVSFLKKWSLRNPNQKIDLLYLDSWDVDWKNPDVSGIHGLSEFLAVSNHLKTGSLLLIDDTPKDEKSFLVDWEKPSFLNYYSNHGFYPGKGALVKQLLLSLGRGHEICHGYQLLWEF